MGGIHKEVLVTQTAFCGGCLYDTSALQDSHVLKTFSRQILITAIFLGHSGASLITSFHYACSICISCSYVGYLLFFLICTQFARSCSNLSLPRHLQLHFQRFCNGKESTEKLLFDGQSGF